MTRAFFQHGRNIPDLPGLRLKLKEYFFTSGEREDIMNSGPDTDKFQVFPFHNLMFEI
jgi:hypothetical protein